MGGVGGGGGGWWWWRVCGVWWRVRLVSIGKNRRRLIKARDCLCIIYFQNKRDAYTYLGYIESV